METLVGVACLALCLLEAHLDGAALQVKGSVPDRGAHERAL
jgi:hypothetical protein